MNTPVVASACKLPGVSFFLPYLCTGKFGGESIAGKPFPGWMKFMSPKAVTTMFERMPEERFYCPLSDSEAAKRYVVRGYPVALVNAFAMNSEVNEIARGLTKFLDLNVGFSDLASGGKSDAVTMKMAMDANVSELQAGFDLVCRTLEVLREGWL